MLHGWGTCGFIFSAINHRELPGASRLSVQSDFSIASDEWWEDVSASGGRHAPPSPAGVPAEIPGLFWPGAPGSLGDTKGDLGSHVLPRVAHLWHRLNVLAPPRRLCLVGDVTLFTDCLHISQFGCEKDRGECSSAIRFPNFLVWGFAPATSAACKAFCGGHWDLSSMLGHLPRTPFSWLLCSPWRSDFAQMSAYLVDFFMSSINRSVWELRNEYFCSVFAMWKE